MNLSLQTDSVHLPPSVREMILLKMPEGELHHWVLEAIVVEAAREHIISRRKTASILGFKDFESREAFFERHGLFIEYTMEMAEKDFKSIKHLEALRKRG